MNLKRPGPAISVVTPMYNEAEGVAKLIDEIAQALSGRSFEIIAVDDGSSDQTLEKLKDARQQVATLRIVAHEQNAGQSRALRTGVLAARAPIIVMLDGDGQNDPAFIPKLADKLANGPALLAMVAGERQKRQDTAAKKWASRAANGIRQRILDDGAADTGCGLKAFRREAYLRLPYFDHQHRYLPALMRREGFEVAFEPVNHRARAHGVSKYTNFGRLMVAIRDILGVVWLNARARSPRQIREIEDENESIRRD